MPFQNRPLDIPEIRYRVGLLLDRHDQAVCSRVSKDWSETFTPLLYTSVDLRSTYTEVGGEQDEGLWETNAPSMTSVHSNCRRIRQLTVHVKEIRDEDEEWGLFHGLNGDDNNDQRIYPVKYTWLRDFLADCPNLQRLVLRGFRRHPSLVAELVKRCPELRDLSLIESTFNIKEIAILLTTHCKKVEAVTITDGQHSGEEYGQKLKMPKLFPNIKFLDLQRFFTHADLTLFWVERCPALEELRIEERLNRYHSVDGFSVLRKCPKLARLEIRNLETAGDELATILNFCPELTHLTLRGVGFNQEVYKALRKRHFPTLRVLNLFDAFGMKSWMCGPILALCPNLVEFGLPEMEVDSIVPAEVITTGAPDRKKRLTMAESSVAVTNGPWACKGLTTLKAASIKWSTTAQNDAFFNRLAQLEQLEEFLIGGLDDPSESKDAIARRSEFVSVGARRRVDPGPLVLGELDLKQIQSIQRLTSTWPKLRNYRYLHKPPKMDRSFLLF
ncbi:hypothetical protein EMPS_08548 [Entomortierella parvispora]|uniref:F-box domain-containing protein n=1 Tax=Entomortierella parvispora TaxID=205924 RepID=A0A9P3HG82_9FUNG|nr:hypothetical protein EMPS_08548 [Entomortierella parvispora]